MHCQCDATLFSSLVLLFECVCPLPHQGPVLLTFEDDDLEASELMVSQVSSFQKSAGRKVTDPLF